MKHLRIKGLVAVLLLFMCLGNSAVAADRTWYKGDLHAHSLHSDGDSSVADVIGMAETLGFDFFALTDHDGNMNGIPTQWSDPAFQSDSVTLLYGVEWTTDKGHANVWAASPFDYTPLWDANKNQDVESAARAAHQAGALFSINHPTAYLCCPWEYPIIDGIDAIEVWNSMYRIPNLNSLAVNTVWDDVLMAGRKLPCVGGSDMHELKGFQSQLFTLGNPTTWVYADNKSAQSVLDGIKAGHTSLTYAPDGPRVMFSADQNKDGVFETMIGDNITNPSTNMSFNIDVIDQSVANGCTNVVPLDAKGMIALLSGQIWSGQTLEDYINACPNEAIRIIKVIKNGKLFKAWIVTGNSPSVTFKDSPMDLDYYRVTLIGKPELDGPIEQLLYGRLLALTSPIYCGFHSKDLDMNMYFGNLHSHSEVSDGEGSPKKGFKWARDEAGYDFYAMTDHAEQIRPWEWYSLGKQADNFNEDGRFVAMRGFEWSHPLAGHINVYNTDSYTNCIKTPTLGLLYLWIDRKNGLAQFNHPGREPLTFRNFMYYPFVADNFFAMETGNKDTGNMDGEYLAYYPDALSAGWRVAPSSNQDNHSLSTNSHRTVIIAPELSRKALYSAMKSRRLYSTDDSNIKVAYKLGNHWMGSIVETAAKTLSFTIDIIDDETIESIELVNANGDVVAEKIPDVVTGKLQWCPEIPNVKDAYYVIVTSENTLDNPEAEPIQVTVTAPIVIQ